MKKVLLLSERFPHMGGHSGYDQLSLHLASNDALKVSYHAVLSPSGLYNRLYPLMQKLAGYRVESTPFYASHNFFTERSLAKKARREQAQVVHYLYAEAAGLIADPWFRKQLQPETRLVGTVHQPFSWWKLNANWEMLNHFDKVIVLTPEQQSHFQSVVRVPVVFIPHGVDTRFFSKKEIGAAPGRTKRDVLFVGHWLRDIELVVKVIQHVSERLPSIRFHLVYPGWLARDHWSLYSVARLPNVHFYQRISDEALRDLYAACDLLMLPLFDATANNALLECTSMGIPVLASDIPAMRHYLQEKDHFIRQRDPEAFAGAVVEYMESEHLADHAAISRFAREQFDWSTVASQMKDLYYSF